MMDPGSLERHGTSGATLASEPLRTRKPLGRRKRSAARAGRLAALLAAAVLAASGAMAADVTGVYVAGAGPGAEVLHLKWTDDEVVGRFVTKDHAYLLEGWLEEPGYMGMLFDPAAPDQGFLYFVASPVVEGMKLSLFAMPESGEMDLERPLRTYELERAPGRTPEVPPELLASLSGADEGAETSPGATGADPAAPAAGMPPEMDSAPPPGMQGGAAAGRAGTAGTAGGGPFHGPFHGGDGRGGQALLQLVQQGERVQGELMAFGALAQLAGTVQGNTIEGRVTAVDAAGTFKGTLAGPGLAITFMLRGEGGEATVPLQLERGESKQMGERDPRLVGTWVKSSSYTSGDFSVATSQTCVMRAGGTLTLYDGEMAGGGNAGSFSSGPAQGGVTSRWHTQGNLLYVNGQLYARFGFSGGTLGLWFSENSKPEIWSRQ